VVAPKLRPLWLRIFLLFGVLVFSFGIVVLIITGGYSFIFWKHMLEEEGRYYAERIAYRIENEMGNYIGQGEIILSLLEWGVISSPDQVRSVLIEMNLQRKEATCIWMEWNKNKISSCFKEDLPSIRCAKFPCFVSLIRHNEPELVIGLEGVNGSKLWMEIPVYLFLAKMKDVIERPSISFRIKDTDGLVLWDSLVDSEKYSWDKMKRSILKDVTLPSLGWVIQVGYIWSWQDFVRAILPWYGRMWLMFLLLIVCFVIVVWHTSKGWFGDLQRIIPFIREVGKGNLDVQLDIRREDEIGLLAESVNHMIRELRQYQTASNIGAVGKAVAWISHELKNKLLPVKAFIDSIKERRGDKDFVFRMQKLCQIQLEECDLFLRDLNTLKEDLSVSRRDVAVVDVLKRSVESVTPLIFNTEIKIELVCEDNLRARLDERLFQTAIENLLLNAIEVLKRKGRIRVLAHKDGEDVVIIVEDNGLGIPEGIKDRVFEPFVTLNSPEIPVKRGVGLAIVFSIIQAHGGKISVESEEEKGTRFIIVLPG